MKQLTAFTPAPLITDGDEFWSINNDGTDNDAAVGADYATGHSYCSLVHENQLYIFGHGFYIFSSSFHFRSEYYETLIEKLQPIHGKCCT